MYHATVELRLRGALETSSASATTSTAENGENQESSRSARRGSGNIILDARQWIDLIALLRKAVLEIQQAAGVLIGDSNSDSATSRESRVNEETGGERCRDQRRARGSGF